MTKILVLTGHPKNDSLCAALAERYATAAEAAGHSVRRLRLGDIEMDSAPPDFSKSEREWLADWVKDAQDDISWSEHLVLVTPMWWGSVPAALKHFFDRVLMPGFALRYTKGGSGWAQLLSGRTARVIITGDTPWFFLRWLYGKPIVKELRAQVFEFCGFKPVRTTYFGPVVKSTPAGREKWLTEVQGLATAAQ
ncbi:MAG: NADPH:quinone reductase [Hyphomicrobiales bacterium]|nr:MAG: NADPH:quinone reductase [Hyphomicrobiales bacterium]